MQRTAQQNGRFHKLLTLRRFDREDKAELVKVITGGRTTSSAEMTAAEMKLAIDRLQDDQDSSTKKMRAKIYEIARTIFDVSREQWSQQHYDAVDKLCKRMYKKQLRFLSYKELINVVTAMEKWQDGELTKVLNSLLSDI